MFLKVCYLLLRRIMSAKRIILSSKKLYFNFWKNRNDTYHSDCSFLFWFSRDTHTGWLSVSYCWRIYWSRWFTVVSTENLHGDLSHTSTADDSALRYSPLLTIFLRMWAKEIYYVNIWSVYHWWIYKDDTWHDWAVWERQQQQRNEIDWRSKDGARNR